MIAANGPGGRIRTDENGTISLLGFAFEINGTPFDISEDVTDVAGLLSGVLADGTVFSNVPFDRDPSGDGFVLGTLELLILPEPTSLTLLSVGGIALWMRRRLRKSSC